MDTPTFAPPKDAQEQQILDQLTFLRDGLLLLKADRTKYIRSQDVLPLYDQTLEQVRLLNEIRPEHPADDAQVDRVLESCFLLLSLFFMTIGRNNEAPAAYALTTSIKRLLDHLTEADLFSGKDLETLTQTLDTLSRNIELAETSKTQQHPPYLTSLLRGRVEQCRTSVAVLEKRLERLAPSLHSLHDKCITCLRSIALANTRSRFSATEVRNLQSQLKEIDARRKDGKFLLEDGSVAAGSDELLDLLQRCLLAAEVVLDRKGVVPEPFKPLYDNLVAIRNDLEKLSVTQAWSLRETDLYDYQRQLDRIDESRVGGNWLDDEGNPAEPYVQRTLLYLLRRSYAYIYSLMISSEPVSEALLPIYNQLQTLKRCLIEVKNSGGVQSVRELYPYSMKLNSIDNMRTDGKFLVGDDIPEGQGSVNELLADCFELNYDLRVAAEAEDEAEE